MADLSREQTERVYIEGRLKMENDSIYSKSYTICLSDVDFTKHLRLSALFCFFQDIASEAVEALGIGINTIEKGFSVAWILMRIRADILRNPSWNEKILIDTWPQQPKKLEFERDFIVKDEAGNIIIRAVSTWVILDINTRQIQRSELIAKDYPKMTAGRAIDCKLGKLKPSGQPEIVYRKVIGYSDVDFNGHLNNSRYVDYITDCFTIDNHKQYEVGSIEVNYINEAMPGDTIVLRRDISALDENKIFIEGINEAEEKQVFRAQVKIEKRRL